MQEKLDLIDKPPRPAFEPSILDMVNNHTVQSGPLGHSTVADGSGQPEPDGRVPSQTGLRVVLESLGENLRLIEG
jgi:hypothetical protein